MKIIIRLSTGKEIELSLDEFKELIGNVGKTYVIPCYPPSYPFHFGAPYTTCTTDSNPTFYR